MFINIGDLAGVQPDVGELVVEPVTTTGLADPQLFIENSNSTIVRIFADRAELVGELPAPVGGVGNANFAITGCFICGTGMVCQSLCEACEPTCESAPCGLGNATISGCPGQDIPLSTSVSCSPDCQVTRPRLISLVNIPVDWTWSPTTAPTACGDTHEFGTITPPAFIWTTSPGYSVMPG